MITFVVLAGITVVVTVLANPLVATILKSEQHALLSDRILLLTLKERDTAGMRTFPVNYRQETEIVYMGCDSEWWKHLAGGTEVHLRIKGHDLVGWATPILDDPDRSREGFKKLRPATYKWALWTGAVFVEVHLQAGAP